jgi:peptidoglycan/LPS O-acetylase OafA/YrhL
MYLGINAPAWSISTEMFFYALFPFVVRSLLRSFGASTPRVIWIAAAMPWAIETATALVPHRTAVWTAYVLPPVRLADFIVGILLGIAFVRSKRAPVNRRRATALEILALGAVAAAIAISPRAPEALRYSLFLMPFWAVLIAVFVRQDGAVSALLQWLPFVALGRASFAFYLIHWPVIAIIGGTLGWAHPVLATLIAFSLSVALSLAVYHGVEQPLRARIRAVFTRPRRSLTAAAFR